MSEIVENLKNVLDRLVIDIKRYEREKSIFQEEQKKVGREKNQLKKDLLMQQSSLEDRIRQKERSILAMKESSSKLKKQLELKDIEIQKLRKESKDKVNSLRIHQKQNESRLNETSEKEYRKLRKEIRKKESLIAKLNDRFKGSQHTMKIEQSQQINKLKILQKEKVRKIREVYEKQISHLHETISQKDRELAKFEEKLKKINLFASFAGQSSNKPRKRKSVYEDKRQIEKSISHITNSYELETPVNTSPSRSERHPKVSSSNHNQPSPIKNHTRKNSDGVEMGITAALFSPKRRKKKEVRSSGYGQTPEVYRNKNKRRGGNSGSGYYGTRFSSKEGDVMSGINKRVTQINKDLDSRFSKNRTAKNKRGKRNNRNRRIRQRKDSVIDDSEFDSVTRNMESRLNKLRKLNQIDNSYYY